ncbi:arginine repressor [Kytococcus sp. Marseille-QA3725]
MPAATTPTARRQLIADLVTRNDVHTQPQLMDLLRERGVEVSQGTLSRDLDELGAVKVRHGGALVYAVPGLGGDRTPRAAEGVEAIPGRLRRVVGDLLVSAEATGNLVVARTPPGGAQYLASMLDQAELTDLLGTVAGDDTLLLVARGGPESGADLAAHLLTLAERRTDREGAPVPTPTETVDEQSTNEADR